MAKIVSSYCTKVIGENRIFKDTIRVYHDALSLLIRIVESEWDTGLGELYAKSTLKAQRTVELLVHASRTSVAKYPEFDKQFYKYPVTCGGPRFPRRLAPYLRTVLLFLIGRVQAEKGKNLNSRPLVQLCRLSTKTICTKTTVMGLPV